MLWKHEKPFNSNVKVRDVLLNVGLATDDQRPVVCIDECQVPFEKTSPFKSFTIIVGPVGPVLERVILTQPGFGWWQPLIPSTYFTPNKFHA